MSEPSTPTPTPTVSSPPGFLPDCLDRPAFSPMPEFLLPKGSNTAPTNPLSANTSPLGDPPAAPSPQGRRARRPWLIVADTVDTVDVPTVAVPEPGEAIFDAGQDTGPQDIGPEDLTDRRRPDRSWLRRWFEPYRPPQSHADWRALHTHWEKVEKKAIATGTISSFTPWL